MKKKTFSFGDVEYKHEIGNSECPECWGGFPVLCRCGGLVHAQFGDEDEDGYWLYRSCDKCGEDHDEV